MGLSYAASDFFFRLVYSKYVTERIRKCEDNTSIKYGDEKYSEYPV